MVLPRESLQYNDMNLWWQKFWRWYQSQYKLTSIATAVLFSWQLVHLFWLSTAVVIPRLTGVTLFTPGPFFETLLVLVDYTEIPALLGASLLYLNLLQQKFSWRHVGFLILINSQWLHLFWITDEFVLEHFLHTGIGLPFWLAWVAIMIDYLELPVIFDTMRRARRSLRPSPTAANSDRR